DRAVRLVMEGADPDLLTGFTLAPHVDRRRLVVADQHGREPRGPAEVGDEPLDLAADPLAHRCGDGLAVDHGGAHDAFLRGAESAISLRSVPSLANRTTIPPPGSTAVTTPSPKLAWTMSSPVANESEGSACDAGGVEPPSDHPVSACSWVPSRSTS